jgi:thiamine pyrophosphate-dependent acetolactate synthase large subunit-like protein
MAKVDGGRLVVDALKREGVECIFSPSGGHINATHQACLDVFTDRGVATPMGTMLSQLGEA